MFSLSWWEEDRECLYFFLNIWRIWTASAFERWKKQDKLPFFEMLPQRFLPWGVFHLVSSAYFFPCPSFNGLRGLYCKLWINSTWNRIDVNILNYRWWSLNPDESLNSEQHSCKAFEKTSAQVVWDHPYIAIK